VVLDGILEHILANVPRPKGAVTIEGERGSGEELGVESF